MKKRNQLLKSFGIKRIKCEYANPTKEFGYAIDGYANAFKRQIYLHTKARTETVFHELAHVLLEHHVNRSESERAFYIREIEAELVAQECCRVLGYKFNSKGLRKFKRRKASKDLFRYARKRRISIAAKMIIYHCAKLNINQK